MTPPAAGSMCSELTEAPPREVIMIPVGSVCWESRHDG